MNNLQIVQSKMFGETPLDIYQNESGALYMTREQIGTALGYADARVAIKNIHNRNADRLDPLSTELKLSSVENNREVTRNIIAYNLRGVMEICRLSRQPKADAFMDFTWDIMESLHNGNAVLATPDAQVTLAPQAIQQVLEKILTTTQTITQRLNTLDEKVAAMNPQPTLPAPAQKAIAPPPAALPAASWRNRMYTMIRKICELRGSASYTVRVCLDEIYKDMRCNHRFKEERQRESYRQRHPGCGKYISTIDLIEDSETYSDIFEALIKERLTIEQDKTERAELLRQRIKQLTETSSQLDEKKSETPPAPHQPQPQNEPPMRMTKENLVACVESLARLLGDNSINSGQTWRKLYSNMGIKNWAATETCYRKRHPTCKTVGKISRKKLMLDSPVLFRQFKRAWAELYKNATDTKMSVITC